ncbi:MFS transporter [Vigna unguiculata]|uniref:MFS transporter n=1 Tax=Vigna unguiculata TaxID=3917 RepID=A0A4D6LX64_VIGUN|nr:MFS transporter [Vigna unguiculata]
MPSALSARRPRAVRLSSAHRPRAVRLSFAHHPQAVCASSTHHLRGFPASSTHRPRVVCTSSAHRARSIHASSAHCAPTVPSIVDLLTLPFIPDSPKWLAKVGRWKECESALQRLRGKHADVYQEAAEIRVYNKFLVWFGIVWSVKSIDIETCTLTHSKPPQRKPPSSTSLYCRRNNLAGSSIPHSNADEVKVHVPNLAKTRFTFTK